MYDFFPFTHTHTHTHMPLIFESLTLQSRFDTFTTNFDNMWEFLIYIYTALIFYLTHLNELLMFTKESAPCKIYEKMLTTTVLHSSPALRVNDFTKTQGKDLFYSFFLSCVRFFIIFYTTAQNKLKFSKVQPCLFMFHKK